MPATKTILTSVLKSISLSPKEEENINNTAKQVLAKLRKIGLNPRIGGSLAKKTLIKKNRQDVDVFIQFKDQKEMNTKFYPKLEKLDWNGQFLHGSRDYYTFNYNGIIFEVIPVIKFKKPEKAENVTDFSLMHVNFIKQEINRDKNLANEIKLAKAFCHAQNVYGAESYIGGFSGYALEVLLCHYKTFMNFLKKVQKEKVIDPQKKFKNKNEIMRELNQSKLNSPIILIDPTYKYRNISAGLTNETYEIFIKAAKDFLRKPSEQFFVKKEFNLKEFLEKSKKMCAVKLIFSTGRQEGDIAGTKMKKFFRFLIEELKRKKQGVVNSEFIYGSGQEAVAYLAIKIQKEFEVIGPKKNKEMKMAIEKFKKTRKRIYFSKGFACAKEEFNLKEFFKKQTEVASSMSLNFTAEEIN